MDVFAYEPTAAPPGNGPSSPPNPFPGTSRITLEERNGLPARVEVVADEPRRVRTYYDERTDRCLYAWGPVVHSRVQADALPQWCLDVAGRRSFGDFTELLGNFILLVDDRRAGRVLIVPDVLGVRPWFVGQRDGRFVCGSDVWRIRDAGLAGSEIDYDAVSAWLQYGYDCSGGSLFAALKRPAPGTLVEFHDGQTHEVRFANLPAGGDEVAPAEQIVQGVHERVSRAFAAAVAGVGRITLPLSGGFDSRYLAALAKDTPGLDVQTVTVANSDAESAPAARVAQVLGLPHETIRVDGSELDAYDEPYHFTPAGFPITKQVSAVAAARGPADAPVVSGYLGETLVRDGNDRCLGKREHEFPEGEDLAAVLLRHHRLRFNRLDLMDDAVVRRVEARAVRPMREAVEQGRAVGKPFLYANLLSRQRCYLANNFLQFLHLRETILPFYSWDLIEYRLRHRYGCFTWQTYELLFRTYYPQLAEIPHSTRTTEAADGAAATTKTPPSRHARPWARELLTTMLRPGRLSAVPRRKAVHRLAAAALGRGDHEHAVIFLERLWLLEQRLKAAGVEFDWRGI
jgi:hypothetical protein